MFSIRHIGSGLAAILCTLLFNLPAFSGWQQPPRPINPTAFTKTIDPHANSGGRRIVRIDRTIIAICPHDRGEETYRSQDNGNTWQKISSVDAFSGSLVTGPNQTVYHFFVSGDKLMMEKYRYDHPPPWPTAIYQHQDLYLSDAGPYRAVNATVDSKGTLYVSAHWGKPDRMFLLRSEDGGNSWQGPFEISAGLKDSPRYYQHLEVTSDDILVCIFGERIFKPRRELWFGKSLDRGETWQLQLISNEFTQNPSILTVGPEKIFVFAQSSEASHRGLIFKRSFDGGKNWNKWKLIDPTCGYADPSPALGADGKTIYIAFRSSNGTGVKTGSCGDRSRSRLVISPDLGKSWRIVDDHYNAERTGTRYQIRYQTWWNYGGPLEWIWMQYEKGGSARPIYYDVNLEVEIFNNTLSTP